MKNLLTGLFMVLAFNSFGQPTIFATIAGGDLYSFDLTNCTRQLIGSTGQGFGDIAFTPNGQLWGIVGGQLFQIDPSTANATLIGHTGIGAVSLVGLDDETLLAEYDKKLHGINTSDASSFYIDIIGYQAAGDLTWYDDDLYMVTGGDQIIKMVLNSSYTAILSITPIGSAVPTCEGAVTASFEDEYNSIVGFNGHNLIKICQIDGSTQMLCPDLNLGGTPGAASIRLPAQSPPPARCKSSVSVESVETSQLFSIYPNPAKTVLNIETNNNRLFTFMIYNSLGQLVKTGNVGSDTTSIAIGELTNGFYSILLSAGNKTERHGFVVGR